MKHFLNNHEDMACNGYRPPPTKVMSPKLNPPPPVAIYFNPSPSPGIFYLAPRPTLLEFFNHHLTGGKKTRKCEFNVFSITSNKWKNTYEINRKT